MDWEKKGEIESIKSKKKNGLGNRNREKNLLENKMVMGRRPYDHKQMSQEVKEKDLKIGEKEGD